MTIWSMAMMTDPEEAPGLSELHKCITANLEYLLHPSIEQALSMEGRKQIRIASVSRGDQFAEGAKSLFDGRTTSITKISFDEVTESSMQKGLQEQFDVVAIRLLHVELKPDQWDRVMRNFVELLRPGGWIQWIDFDPMTARVATVKAGAPDAVLRRILNQFGDALRANKVGNTYRISTAMSPLLEEDDSDMYAIRPEARFTRIVIADAVAYLEKHNVYTAGQADEVRAQAETEIETTAIFFDLWCHIGRKSAEVLSI